MAVDRFVDGVGGPLGARELRVFGQKGIRVDMAADVVLDGRGFQLRDARAQLRLSWARGNESAVEKMASVGSEEEAGQSDPKATF